MKAIERVLVLALMSALGAARASTTEERLLTTIRQAYPGTRIDSVSATPIPGLYEVWMGPNVAFMSANEPKYMVFGRLVDVAAMRDLTAPKLAAARAAAGPDAEQADGGPVDVAALPLADAIKTTLGDGSRRIVLFSDPLCGYCRQLETELAGLKDVAIYNFMVPFQGRAAPVAVWCAADRADAWRKLMASAEPDVSMAVDCPNPVDRNLQLARKLGIRGTPTIVLPNGERLSGVVSTAVIESRLAALSGSNKPDGIAHERSGNEAANQ